MLRASVFLFVFSLAAYADITADQLEQKLIQRTAIMANADAKEASDLLTPAYFLASEVAGLQIDIRRLEYYRSVRLDSMMWTGFFWPNYLGGLGYRVSDTNFPRQDYGKARDYVRARPVDGIANDLLSPSEKYDIVMGINPAEEGSLTSKQWSLGADEYARTGKVETWQGICHGWAPASINLPVPTRSVVFSTRRGNITFTPDDIKALGSLLYANGRYESVYTGVRCNSSTPTTDGAGRVTTPECFDINPADWHIIMTHHLGMGRRPFVIDMVNSNQVWNKPVIGYSYVYRNIKHGISGSSISLGTIPVAEARSLRFAAYRNLKTRFVLGISMTITYLDGGFVRNNMNNTKELLLNYDLELDENYQIIGGEWQDNKHPDFVWKPRFLALPTTEGDAQTSSLKAWEAAVNPAWRDPALKSITHGAPLTKFVKYLFDYSGAL